MDSMTAKMSAFARAYHYNNNETHVFADRKAEMILGDDYEKIAANLTQGIPFFLPNYQGTKEEGLRKIVDSQIWWVIHFEKNVYAAIGNSGNMIYVNPEENTTAAVSSYFKPTVYDRVDFIENVLLPCFR